MLPSPHESHRLTLSIHHSHSNHTLPFGPLPSLQAVEDLCRHGMQERLYQRLAAECDAHIGSSLAALAGQTQLAPAAFLEAVAAVWEDHCANMLLIRSIFLYLDRTYVMTLPGLRSLYDTGLGALRQHLAAHPKVGWSRGSQRQQQQQQPQMHRCDPWSCGSQQPAAALQPIGSVAGGSSQAPWLQAMPV